MERDVSNLVNQVAGRQVESFHENQVETDAFHEHLSNGLVVRGQHSAVDAELEQLQILFIVGKVDQLLVRRRPELVAGVYQVPRSSLHELLHGGFAAIVVVGWWWLRHVEQVVASRYREDRLLLTLLFYAAVWREGSKP